MEGEVGLKLCKWVNKGRRQFHSEFGSSGMQPVERWDDGIETVKCSPSWMHTYLMRVTEPFCVYRLENDVYTPPHASDLRKNGVKVARRLECDRHGKLKYGSKLWKKNIWLACLLQVDPTAPPVVQMRDLRDWYVVFKDGNSQNWHNANLAVCTKSQYLLYTQMFNTSFGPGEVNPVRMLLTEISAAERFYEFPRVPEGEVITCELGESTCFVSLHPMQVTWQHEKYAVRNKGGWLTVRIRSVRIPFTHFMIACALNLPVQVLSEIKVYPKTPRGSYSTFNEWLGNLFIHYTRPFVPLHQKTRK